MRCKKCGGQLEPIVRGGQFVFNFCRPCKLRYTKEGYLEMAPSEFNILKEARAIVGKTNEDASPVARSALEILLMQGLWESYYRGLKDGVLLAYSQDVGDSEPIKGT